MVNKIFIVQIDAFTEKPFCGNPAGVTYGDGLTSVQMQKIASEMNLSETAFLIESDKANFQLRWFTPYCEVKLCGHATIAALHFLFEGKIIHAGDTITFETLSGILRCGFNNNKYFMQMPIYETEIFDRNKDEILDVLNLERTKTIASIPFILASNGYLYIYLEDLNELTKLQPDYNRVKKLCNSGLGFNCIAVFTQKTIDSGNDAHLRFFAPSFGINEDPVTGSANGPLLLVMKKLGMIIDEDSFITRNFEQGDLIGRPGRVEVTYNRKSNELFIAGNAVTVLKGEMIL